MKKIVAILLVTIMALTLACVSPMASAITNYITADGKKIVCVDFLDFTEKNNGWAKQNASGEWEPSDMDMSPFDENDALCGAYLNPSFTKTYTADKLKWSLTDGGEVLHVEAISGSAVPGMCFRMDDFTYDIPTGSELAENPCAEYLKIRIRNYSSADQLSFGFTNTNINGGASFLTVSISNLDIASTSGEWITYTFSMRDINSATNYGDGLEDKNKDGILDARWGAKLKDLFVFPFGYNITDGTGAYNGAEMDIDYIVIGSKEYVTGYKSALETKEESVSSLKLVKEPTKKAYYVGEQVDLSGFELEATFKDGTKEIIDSPNLIYNFNEETSSAPVTLKYGSATASFNVKVTGIKDISIATEPTTTTYTKVDVAKALTPTGLTIKVNYNDGTTAEYGVGSFKLEYAFTDLGPQTVTINFYGAKTSFTINLINVVGIKVEPVAKTLRYNSTLEDSDLAITCIYSDGSEKSLADANIAATIEKEYVVTEPGTIDVKVSVSNVTYEIDCSATTTATVEAPTSLSVEATDSAKTTYNVGESFSTAGYKVSYVYADGTTELLKNTDEVKDFKIRYDFGEPGTKSVTFTDSFVGLSATFDATVEGAAISTTTTTSTTKKDSGSTSAISPVVIIVIVVAVVAISAVVVFIVIKKKKTK